MIPAVYAAPAPTSLPGIPRYVVVNESVARGGQPSGAGFRNLASAGFRTVVDLQEKGSRSKEEKHLVEALGMKYVNVPMKGMKTPEEKQISKALKALLDQKAGPVFIHCKRGADRTGVVLACYRMEHDGWGNSEALQEARDLGMYWYQFPLQRYIMSYRPHGTHNGVVDSVEAAGEGAVEKLKNLPAAIGGIFH
jgi:protein tyrosine phosphatase (PTP) superfamily phosphohydrolase (DUF442 family)